MKFSIVTATYNSASYITGCLNSVNKQTHQEIEHIIIDGASEDNTIDVINSLPTRVAIMISEPDKGIYDAINKGIRLATGGIIGLVHSSDELANNYVLSNIEELFHTTQCDILYSNTECFVPANRNKVVRIIRVGPFKKILFLKGWMPSHPTVYCKKEVFEKVGFYRLDLQIAADYEFLLRAMFINELKIHYFDSITYRYELGGISSKNLKNIIQSNLECKKAWVFNGKQPPRFLIYNKLLRKIPQFLSPLSILNVD